MNNAANNTRPTLLEVLMAGVSDVVAATAEPEPEASSPVAHVPAADRFIVDASPRGNRWVIRANGAVVYSDVINGSAPRHFRYVADALSALYPEAKIILPPGC